MIHQQVAVVILNFNNRFFLEKFLPGVLLHSKGCDVYVADNASSDDSLNYVRSHFPEVRIIETGANLGYAGGYNKALAQIPAKYHVLLNSDVEVSAGWIEPVIALMEKNTSIAACQPKILSYDDRTAFEYAGAAGGYIDRFGYPFCRGRIFNHIEKDQGQYNNSTEIFWATGACLFVRKTAFDQAGGLDDLFFAHMEEIDLCWRLKNFGHRIYVEPASVIYHVGGGTLSKISPQKTFLNFRNNLSTLTKNHPPRGLFAKVLFRMVLDGVAAFKFLAEGEPKHFSAVLRAHFAYYSWLPRLMRERKRLKNQTGFRYCFSQVYKGNIVHDYFLKKKKKFSDLSAGFFTEQ